MKRIKLGPRLVGDGEAPYFIADIGSNHNGDMVLCKKLIDAGIGSGVDSVKFQSFDTKSLISKTLYDRHLSYPGDTHRHFGSLYEMVKKYYLRPEQHKFVANYCKKKGITFSSTSLSPNEVDMLINLGVPFFKVASMDVTNHPLLEYVSSKRKPVILSTGMASLWEIDQAMEIFRKVNAEVILLHCIATYPAKIEDINLNNIEMLKKTFGVPVGYSDNSDGISIPIAAIALGACIIEKHFTLDKKMSGWDHVISADPQDMKYIIEEGKKVVKALGSHQRKVSKKEMQKRKEFRRSIVAAHDLNKGQKIRLQDMNFKRPEEGGISPSKFKDLIGRKVNKNVNYDQQIKPSDLL